MTSPVDSQDQIDRASLDRVKGEITFFMEKTFQVSFGYVGALIALTAAAKLDVGSSIARNLGIELVALVCSGLLVVNAAYLALAAGTLFATLKRGLFLIVHDSERGGHRTWESFVRVSRHSPFSAGPLGGAAWNVDNYYMVPLFSLIIVVSAVATGFGLTEAEEVAGRILVIGAATSHLVPFAMLIATWRIAGHVAAHPGLVDTERPPDP